MAKRLLVGVFVLTYVAVSFGQSKPSLQGVWRVTESTGGRGAASPTAVNSKPQPGVYIFTGRHYSITRVTGETPRAAIKDPAKPTVAEFEELMRFAAQAGTYTTTGDTLTFQPIAALGVANMAPGVSLVSTFKLDGNTLTLISKNPQGGPSNVKLTRIE